MRMTGGLIGAVLLMMLVGGFILWMSEFENNAIAKNMPLPPIAVLSIILAMKLKIFWPITFPVLAIIGFFLGNTIIGKPNTGNNE